MAAVVHFPGALAGAKCNRAREARENERARERARRTDTPEARSAPAMGPEIRGLFLEKLLHQRIAVERLRVELSIAARLLRERLLLEQTLAERALVVDSAARRTGA